MKFSQEHRANLSKSVKGRALGTPTTEHRLKLSAAKTKELRQK